MKPHRNGTPTTDWTKHLIVPPLLPNHTTTDAEHVVVLFAEILTKHACFAIDTTRIEGWHVLGAE